MKTPALRASAVSVLVLACSVTATTLGAGGQSSSLEVSSTRAGSSLSLAGRPGATIHQTTNFVLEPRAIQVPGTSTVLALWKESRRDDDDAAAPGAPGAAAFFAIALDGVHFGRARQADYSFKLRLASFDPLQGVPPAPPNLAAPADDDPNSQHLYIVQFHTTPLEPFLDRIRDLGGATLIYLPDCGQAVRMTPIVRDRVAALPFVRWIGPLHPAYKLDQSLVAELVDGIGTMPTRRYSIALFERGPFVQQVVSDRITALGGQINTTIPEGFRIEATISPAQLLEVARMNEVEFIDTWSGASDDMNIARRIDGSSPVLSGLGFTGQGVRAEVMDVGFRSNHDAFANPAPLIHGAPVTSASHGTSTYGINFGNGAANSAGTGMLPNRDQGIFCTYNQLSGFGGSTSRYTLTAELTNPAGLYRAVYQSCSFGTAITTTQYTTISSEMDDILFLNDILVCQSQSNTGTTSSRAQAWAKNIVSVGGVTHQNTLGRSDDTWSDASTGPAADGRIKPDLAHFNDQVLCPTSTTATAYTTDFSGTSSATPIVAGHFGLLFQMWHEEVFSGFGGAATVFLSRPHMATAKAMLINSAFRYNWLAGGPNGNMTRVRQGWGMPDLTRLYYDRFKTFIVNETDLLTPLSSTSYQLHVASGEPEFRATLVYTDPKGSPMANPERINDLSLKVTSPNGTIYWGNNGLTAGNYSTAGGSSNTIDTVENVFLANPQAGFWTVTVLGDVIVQDSHAETPALDADYALVVAGVTPIVMTPCPADVDHDSKVDAGDFLAVLEGWGPCATSCSPHCDADIAPAGGDCVVDLQDLEAVIGAWGECQ